jgi:hypothetical protein
MKTIALMGILTLVAGRIMAGEAGLAGEVSAAAKKLGDPGNYSWKTTVEIGNFTGVTEGKADKEGVVGLTIKFGDNTTEAFLKGAKGAVKPQDQNWQTLADLAAAVGTEPGPRQFLVRRLQTFKAPTPEILDLLGKSKDLKKVGEVCSGDLTEAGAKEILSFGGRRGPNAPEPKNAKGSLKFWIKDGVLSKYEVKVQGNVNFNGEDRDIDRTSTVEIKDVGTTKVDVPEAAKPKLM